MPDYALSVTLDGTPDLVSATLQALYRLTGRSTVELREAIAAGRPVYAASLFDAAHLTAVPRLEKTIAFLEAEGLEFRLTETVDGVDAPIDLPTLRELLEASDDDADGDE